MTPDVLREQVTCNEPGHVDGCAGTAGGEHEYVTRRLNEMRCTVCGHRLDSMGDCDSCASDQEAETFIDHADRHPDTVEGCDSCESREERVGMAWQRMGAPY